METLNAEIAKNNNDLNALQETVAVMQVGLSFPSMSVFYLFAYGCGNCTLDMHKTLLIYVPSERSATSSDGESVCVQDEICTRLQETTRTSQHVCVSVRAQKLGNVCYSIDREHCQIIASLFHWQRLETTTARFFPQSQRLGVQQRPVRVRLDRCHRNRLEIKVSQMN